MYALIYEEHEPSEITKEVLSVHKTRAEAEKALEKRQHRLKRRVWECYARIVWILTGRCRILQVFLFRLSQRPGKLHDPMLSPGKWGPLSRRSWVHLRRESTFSSSASWDHVLT